MESDKPSDEPAAETRRTPPQNELPELKWKEKEGREKDAGIL